MGACDGTATWNPGAGYVPRGFIGALGAIDEVKVVILVAEFGDPHLFPDLRLRDQLRKAWITETYLCSAAEEAGRVPSSAENECVSCHLSHQLEVFGGLPVIALGTKAQARANRISGRVAFHAVWSGLIFVGTSGYVLWQTFREDGPEARARARAAMLAQVEAVSRAADEGSPPSRVLKNPREASERQIRRRQTLL